MDKARLRRYQRWLENRWPFVGGWFRRWAARILAADGSPNAVQLLAEALVRSPDERVGAIAFGFMRGLESQPCIDAVCAVWSASRHEALESLIVGRRWAAAQPPALRVLTALKGGRPELAVGMGAASVGPLLSATSDKDPVISSAAAEVLAHLEDPDAREEVCRRFLLNGSVAARKAALSAGYLPRDERHRALFFFLTEQWERYEALDFDRRLLRAAYAAAEAGLRQRVMERLRASGRVDYLTVVAGGDFRERASVMSEKEAEFLVEMLVSNREWQKLWHLAFDLSLAQSARIIRGLAQARWHPDAPDDRSALEELAALVRHGMALEGAEVVEHIPPAVRRAHATVSARVNDVAFSSVRPVIAIGTSQRQVVLWDFQRAARDCTADGFGHSIGRVAFAGDGTLLLGERTNRPDVPCRVYGWRDGESFVMGEHQGTVTAVEPVGKCRFLTTGRDGRVVVWDASRRSLVGETSLDDWARAACVSPDGGRAALLHEGITLLSVPELQFVAGTGGGAVLDVDGTWRSSGYGSGVARAAAFAPDGEVLVFGKNSGEVRAGTVEGDLLVAKRLVEHEGAVQGIASLSDPGVVVAASADGTVYFTDWGSRRVVGEIRVPGQRLTSIRVSPDGAFMAVGDSDATMSLWDLRVLGVRAMVGRPLAQALPVHLAVVGTLQALPGLPANVRQSLRFIECLLRHRHRYDIEVDALVEIQAGEFDIEIEG